MCGVASCVERLLYRLQERGLVQAVSGLSMVAELEQMQASAEMVGCR